LLDDRLIEDTRLGETTRWALINEIKPRLRGSAATASSEFVAAMGVKDGFMNSCRFVVDLTSIAKDLDRDQVGSTSLYPA